MKCNFKNFLLLSTATAALLSNVALAEEDSIGYFGIEGGPNWAGEVANAKCFGEDFKKSLVAPNAIEEKQIQSPWYYGGSIRFGAQVVDNVRVGIIGTYIRNSSALELALKVSNNAVPPVAIDSKVGVDSSLWSVGGEIDMEVARLSDSVALDICGSLGWARISTTIDNAFIKDLYKDVQDSDKKLSSDNVAFSAGVRLNFDISENLALTTKFAYASYGSLDVTYTKKDAAGASTNVSILKGIPYSGFEARAGIAVNF